MAGVNMRLLSKKSLDYSQLAVNQQQMLIVNTSINVANYREGTLVVRVHGALTIGGNAAIKILLVRTAPTEEDPGMLFTLTDQLAGVTIDAATAAPSTEMGILLVSSLPNNFGGYLALAVLGVQDSSVQTIKATISVDLNLKE